MNEKVILLALVLLLTSSIFSAATYSDTLAAYINEKNDSLSFIVYSGKDTDGVIESESVLEPEIEAGAKINKNAKNISPQNLTATTWGTTTDGVESDIETRILSDVNNIYSMFYRENTLKNLNFNGGFYE